MQVGSYRLPRIFTHRLLIGWRGILHCDLKVLEGVDAALCSCEEALLQTERGSTSVRVSVKRAKADSGEHRGQRSVKSQEAAW